MTHDGGPAFPSVLYSHERAENWSTDGMSLRDWFAGQALMGISVGYEVNGEPLPGNDTLAREAYCIADAMLAARAALHTTQQPPHAGDGQ